jgi:hypothetical protein
MASSVALKNVGPTSFESARPGVRYRHNKTNRTDKLFIALHSVHVAVASGALNLHTV